MSFRGILIGIVVLAAIGLANIFLLLRPHRESTAQPASAPLVQSSDATAPAVVAAAVVPFQKPATVSAPAGAAMPVTTSPSNNRSAPGSAPTGSFALERQTLSPSGSLRVSYWRDRKEKTRRITLEDAHHPERSSVLFEAKGNAWALVSPDDQWVALDERPSSDGGGVRLYHRKGPNEVQFDSAEGGATGQGLQESVWHAYLEGTQSDPATARHGITIDATAWEADSRTLDVSVAYLRTAGETDVPDPWSCNYDVVANKVQPLDQVQSSEVTTVSGPATAAQPLQPNEAAQGENDQATAENDDEFPGEKFPATRTEELTVPDVNESSASEVTYAINEMFARHGADFGDKKVNQQFAQFAWYQPRPNVSIDEIEGEFSDLEKQNLKVLGRCRDAKKAAAHRAKARPTRAARGQQVQPDDSPGAQILSGILQGVLDNLGN